MFTCRCFVRVDSYELRKKLKDFGYWPFYDVYEEEIGKILGVNHQPWNTPSYFIIHYPEMFDDFIDCKDNVQLFLALAALNDSTDYMQWFTNGSDWILCDRDDWMDTYSTLCSGGKYSVVELNKFHKATPDELIKFYSRSNIKSIWERIKKWWYVRK